MFRFFSVILILATVLFTGCRSPQPSNSVKKQPKETMEFILPEVEYVE